VEHVGGHRINDSVIPALLEAEGMSYTGASAHALAISRDKYLSKLVVTNAGISIPKSIVLPNWRASIPSNIKFPVIVKPLNQDGSEGITTNSLVVNRNELRRQVERVIKSCKALAICEEFLAGRELYVTLSG